MVSCIGATFLDFVDEIRQIKNRATILQSTFITVYRESYDIFFNSFCLYNLYIYYVCVYIRNKIIIMIVIKSDNINACSCINIIMIAFAAATRYNEPVETCERFGNLRTIWKPASDFLRTISLALISYMINSY